MRAAGIAAALVAMTLAACASPQTRVEQGLIDAGIEPQRASCMAEILTDRLSVGQLKKLGELGKLKEESGKDLTVGFLLENSEAVKDPEILAAVGVALTSC